MDKLLTVLVPSYNMEKYLEKGLSSLVIRENLLKYLEVLVINDGSKDSTSTIAHRFEHDYPGVFTAIDKENGNYGSCVNAGLKLAKGTFIKILDADDYFWTDGFESLIEKLKSSEENNENIQLFLLEFNTVNENGKFLYAMRPIIEPNKVFEFPETVNQDYIANIGHHLIVYRTNLLLNMHYKQTERVSYSDTEWSVIPQLAVQRIKYIPIPVYQYLLGREGQTMDPKVLTRSLHSMTVVARNMITTINESKDKYPAANYELVVNRTITFLRTIYSMFIMTGSIENVKRLEDFDNWIKQHAPVMYGRIDGDRFSRKYPVRYIHNFRKGTNSIPFKTMRRVYAMFH